MSELLNGDCHIGFSGTAGNYTREKNSYQGKNAAYWFGKSCCALHLYDPIEVSNAWDRKHSYLKADWNWSTLFLRLLSLETISVFTSSLTGDILVQYSEFDEFGIF
jgi:hypothetical protein